MWLFPMHVTFYTLCMCVSITRLVECGGGHTVSHRTSFALFNLSNLVKKKKKKKSSLSETCVQFELCRSCSFPMPWNRNNHPLQCLKRTTTAHRHFIPHRYNGTLSIHPFVLFFILFYFISFYYRSTQRKSAIRFFSIASSSKNSTRGKK